MKIYDISVPIDSSLPVWPGDPLPVVTNEITNHVQVSQVNIGAHTGTHVDAPIHFIPGGKTIESIELQKMIGSCLVLQIPDNVIVITAEILKSMTIPAGTKRILLKTANSNLWQQRKNEFDQNYVALTGCAAQFLVDLKIDLVGIDYLSIAPLSDIDAAHQVLLHNEVVILEGLNLCKVVPGSYELFCLPVLLSGSDGAPARVVLLDRS